MAGTRVWKVRIPSNLWNDLVQSGKLLAIVHKEIERGMWQKGFVKVRKGGRWFWFDAKEIEAARNAQLRLGGDG